MDIIKYKEKGKQNKTRSTKINEFKVPAGPGNQMYL